ncbi:MAG TPA: LON peptidase substrate-binding domain-containing protein [Verrucomicrobiaceae bacterium]
MEEPIRSCDIPQTELPAELPVMVLPDCHLFPGCLLPLFIFEERYRQMLAQVLSSNRMFCIGNRDGTLENSPVSNYSTAGLVRCCVRQDSGTSHLLLLGLKRVRFTGWVREKPFPIARVEPVVTKVKSAARAQELKDRALALFHAAGDEQAKQLRSALENKENAEMVCDVLSYHFTRCPKLQQKLLAESSLERRYEMLIEALEKTKCEE